MNSNLKNAAIGLLMLGAGGGITAGITYGIKHALDNKTEQTVSVTNPTIADDSIKQADDFSKLMFEAEQNIQKNKQERINFNNLSDKIIEYTQFYNQSLMQLDSLNKTGNTDLDKINEIITKLNTKYTEIQNFFDNYKTDDPNITTTVENLHNRFYNFESSMKPLLNKYLPEETK